MTAGSANSNAERERLHGLLGLVRDGNLSVTAFCDQFEQTYNLEVDKSTLSDREAKAFADLFEVVVWFSPYEEERRDVPNYVGEDEVMAAVRAAIEAIES